MLKELSAATWQHSKAEIFWGEIAPADHVVQIYETDEVFLDTLAGFVGGGINAGDAVIVIATKSHLDALNNILTSCGVQVDSLVADHRYFPLDAQETLSLFMVDGWPDEELFNIAVSGLMEKAAAGGKRVRAFGEMVALLWAEGNNGATVQLEHLWNKMCEKKTFSLFCAYPKTGFTQDMKSSLSDICCAHSKQISGTENQMKEVYYQAL